MQRYGKRRFKIFCFLVDDDDDDDGDRTTTINTNTTAAVTTVAATNNTFSCGCAVLEERWPSLYEKFRNSFSTVGRTGTGVRSVEMSATAQHRKTRSNIHDWSGIRTRGTSTQAIMAGAIERTFKGREATLLCSQ